MIFHRSHQQFIKFIISGVFYNLVAYLIYAWLLFVECNYFLASTASFIVGVMLSYLINSWIFTNKPHRSALLPYFMYYVILLVINWIILHTFVNLLKINVYFAQIIIMVIASLITYKAMQVILK